MEVIKVKTVLKSAIDILIITFLSEYSEVYSVIQALKRSMSNDSC